MSTVYYCPEVHGNFFELKDALNAAASEAIRTGEECAVVVNTGTQHYTYCYVRKGDQA